MTNTWFTSDHHFGHKNILEFEPIARPFKDLNEMHEVLIERWNKMVAPDDKVYYLGDFAFGKQNLAIAARLHGYKYLVMGNHDTYEAREYLKYFNRLFGMTFWHKCILSHVPVHPNNLVSRSILNVHGHLHSKRVKIIPDHTFGNRDEYPDDPAYFNVSVECNDLTPVSADIILDRMNSL